MSPRISLPRLSSFGFSQITTPGPLSPLSKRKFLSSLPPSPIAATPKCPPPPTEPFPFLWQCCSCYTVYRFATTRRCLLCSHNYCTRAVASESTDASTTTPSGGNKKRRRKNKYCRSEFDYEGWARWGTWRRGHALGIESTYAEDADWELRERESKFVKKTQNCFVDCDFPSQCYHTQLRVLEENMRAPEKEGEDAGETLTEEDDQILKAYAASSKILHEEDYEEYEEEDDDYLELNLARDLAEDDEDARSPTSPSSRTPFFYDENRPSSNGSSSAGVENSVVIPGLSSSPTSPAVDATKLTRGELFALIDEDDDMMPLEESKTWRRAGADSRLSVRPGQSQPAVSWADLPDSLDDLGKPGDEQGRPGSSDSHSSSSSAEWEDIDDDDEDEADVDIMEVVDDSAAERERVEVEMAMRDFKRARHAFMIEAEP